MIKLFGGHKLTPKEYVKLIVALILFVALTLGLMKLIIGKPKETKTISQVSEVMTAHGYTVTDITSNLHDKYPDVRLIEGYYYNKEDIQFEYYIFDDNKQAYAIKESINSNMVNIKSNSENGSYSDDGQSANVSTFALTADGKFYRYALLRNTLLYVTCNEESKNEAYVVINELDYNVY